MNCQNFLKYCQRIIHIGFGLRKKHLDKGIIFHLVSIAYILEAIDRQYIINKMLSKTQDIYINRKL